MSVIMTTFENGELVSSRADDFFRYHDHERTMVEETGSVESHVGHATLRKVERDVIAAYASEHGDPWVTERRNFTPGWYVDVRGEDGTVWAFYYGGYCAEHDDVEGTLPEEVARRDFAEAQRVYSQWLDDVEGVDFEFGD